MRRALPRFVICPPPIPRVPSTETRHTGPHWAATQVRVSSRSNSTEPTIVVYPRRVRGTVVTAEGKPAAGETIELSGSSYEFEQIRDLREADAPWERSNCGSCRKRITYSRPRGDKTVSAIQRRIVARACRSSRSSSCSSPRRRVHGRVVRAKDKSPLSGTYVGLQVKMTNEYYKLPKDQQLPNPGNSRRGIFANIYRGMPSGSDGQFEFYVAPGQYIVQLNTLWRADPIQIDVTHQKDLVVDLVDNRPEQSVLKGRVVLKSDPTRGVPRATITGADVANSFGNQFSIVADGEGRFEVQRGEADMLVFAASDTLAGAVHIKSTDKAVTVPVGPTASATGTLIDEATGQPAANREVSFGVRLPEAGGPFSWQFPQTATTDAKGRFNVKHLAVGLKYDAHAETERNDQGPFAWHSIADVVPKDAQPIDLGECKLPAPYRPQTLEQQITLRTGIEKATRRAARRALEDARLFENRVLIVAVSPKSVACRRIFAIQYGEDSHAGDEQAREALGNFTRISIDASAPRYAAELTTFLARWNLTSPCAGRRGSWPSSISRDDSSVPRPQKNCGPSGYATVRPWPLFSNNTRGQFPTPKPAGRHAGPGQTRAQAGARGTRRQLVRLVPRAGEVFRSPPLLDRQRLRLDRGRSAVHARRSRDSEAAAQGGRGHPLDGDPRRRRQAPHHERRRRGEHRLSRRAERDHALRENAPHHGPASFGD